MLALAVALALAASPEAPADPGPALLAAAARAHANEDRSEAERLLRARAQLKAGGAVPADLSEISRAATEWAAAAAPLRVFASRVGAGRVRVGVDDAARAVDRLDVYLVGPQGPARLTRAESEAVGRNEYLLPPGSVGEIRVDAVLISGGDEIVLVRVSSPAEAAPLPTAPAPPPPAVTAQVAPPPAAEAASVPWWWFAAAGVAAALVGAAVWQETR